MAKAEKSGVPTIAPSSGVSRSLTSAVTTAVNAVPITTATARSRTLPRRRNCLNPFMRCSLVWVRRIVAVASALRVHRRGERQGRQRLLDLRAVRLEPWRQDQQLAEVRRILVDGEPGSVGGELEENAAGFAEVHRLEPEAIDHRRRIEARGLDVAPQVGLVRVVVDAPGEMMHAADAPRAAARFGRGADVDHARRAVGAVACPATLGTEHLKAEDRGQKMDGRRGIALPHLRAEETANLVFRLDGAVVPRRERPSGRRLPGR